MELQNTMTAQGINIDRVDIRLRIAGAGRFRQFVPTRNGFPTACRNLRKSTIFAGAHLFPLGTDPDFGNTGSGAPHLAFVNLFPMVDAQVIGCLREQYAGLPANVYTSFPLVIRMVASGITDSGQRRQVERDQVHADAAALLRQRPRRRRASCAIRTRRPVQRRAVRHREACACTRRPTVFCQTDADCQGRCLQEGDPNECTCLFGE